nr:HNH/ENDO VII family nuclease [Ruthenibacterium lactatiformans]
MKKKKQKKTDAAGKYTLPAAGPGWEPSLPDPEQPPQVQRLQMQCSALPYVGRAGKNSGAANWVEKLDWKTPSGAPYTSAPEQGGPSNLVELIMAQRGGGGGGFSPGAGAGRGDAPAPGTGVGGGFAGGGGGLWAGDEHAEQSWGDKALRWLDDNLFRPAGYLAEKYAGGAGKQAETLWNGMVTWGRAGAAGELQQDQLAAQQFAFLGGPWETHAQETEKANTAVMQALPQAAQGLRGDAMRDYAEGIDGRYGDPDGLLGWLGERADSAGQGLLSGAARILGVPGAGTAMDFLSTMENAAQQARENGAGEDEAFLYGLGEVVKRIGGQQLEEYFRSKAGELFTRGEVQVMSPREISENYDAIRESMGLWDKDGRLPENMDESGVVDVPAVDSESPAGDNEGNIPEQEKKEVQSPKTLYKRPSGYRKGVRDKVWENAQNSGGEGIDPITQKTIKPEEPWDMGHKPGFEFRKHQESAIKRNISRKQFLDEHNDPEHYRPELPGSNRSHAGEDVTGKYFGP